MFQKAIKSGDFLEFYAFNRSLGIKGITRAASSNRVGKGYRKSFARRSDNVRRSISSFRRLVRANVVGDTDVAFLTLTMFEVVSLASSWDYFNRFIARFRRVAGEDFRYIAVPEFQERGAVHFHVLVFNLPDHFILHEGSFGSKRGIVRFGEFLIAKGYSPSEVRSDRVIQKLWQYGYCDLLPADRSPALAGYLSSYLSGSLQDVRLGGERAFSCSRNVLRPMFSSTSEFTEQELRRMGATREPDFVREFDTEFLGHCRYTCYDLRGVEGLDYTFDNTCWL